MLVGIYIKKQAERKVDVLDSNKHVGHYLKQHDHILNNSIIYACEKDVMHLK